MPDQFLCQTRAAHHPPAVVFPNSHIFSLRSALKKCRYFFQKYRWPAHLTALYRNYVLHVCGSLKSYPGAGQISTSSVTPVNPELSFGPVWSAENYFASGATTSACPWVTPW